MSKEDLYYKGENLKSGSIYFSAREKEMILAMISVYYTTAPTDSEEDGLMRKIAEKVERIKRPRFLIVLNSPLSHEFVSYLISQNIFIVKEKSEHEIIVKGNNLNKNILEKIGFIKNVSEI